MKCKQSEKYLLRSLEDLLNPSETIQLKGHLDNCPSCRKRQSEYQVIRSSLKEEFFPETRPYFWERLHPKLKENSIADPWTVRKQFCLRAVPLSVCFVALLAAAVFLFVPSQQEELNLSQTGVFLLENSNPLGETQTLLSEEGDANKHIMLLFSSLDEPNNIGRNLP
ncbi:anti-sigma factor family protein [Acidobacteriota bacterium]